jgi:hypothetical protein
LQRAELTLALSSNLPSDLTEDLVANFLAIRQDVLTSTLGNASPGKFVETFVQILQFLDSGKFDAKPSVDEFLRGIESRASAIPDDLRICGSRTARAMYSLRSKRNVVHKGEIDPNVYDLRLVHHGAQWIIAELLRVASGVSMQEAGRLVEMVQLPAGGLVEDFEGKQIVVKALASREEALILLHSNYSTALTLSALTTSMDRFKPVTVRLLLKKMWTEKVVEGSPKGGYKLTSRGFNEAIETIRRHL